MTPEERTIVLLRQLERTSEPLSMKMETWFEFKAKFMATIAQAFRAAVEEEREACAKIAEDQRSRVHPQSPQKQMLDAATQAIGQRIAAAIRERAKEKKKEANMPDSLKKPRCPECPAAPELVHDEHSPAFDAGIYICPDCGKKWIREESLLRTGPLEPWPRREGTTR